MNEPIPLEWITNFVQTNQALVQHLATSLMLADGVHRTDFQIYAQLAQVQQDYLQRIGGQIGAHGCSHKPLSESRPARRSAIRS
jgi:hypothetical protein